VPLTPSTFIVVALVVVAGYTVFGVTGFGASPITIPLLVHVLPLTFVLPLAAILDFGSALALGVHTRRQAHGRELLTLVPFTLVGLLLGVTPLVRLPRNATVLALGLFVWAYALYVVFRGDTARRLSRWWAAAAGSVGGVLGALFGMGGPPYVMYIAGRIPDPVAQRATIAQMVILNVRIARHRLRPGRTARLSPALDRRGNPPSGGVDRRLDNMTRRPRVLKAQRVTSPWPVSPNGQQRKSSKVET
jgi:uncharacterized membrane protein YfcA